MAEQTVYGVYRNADLTEGRGPMNLIGLFSSEEPTTAARRGFGVMGVQARDMQDTEVRALRVFDTYEDWARSLPPDSYEARQHRFAIDPEYAEYLRLKEKFRGRNQSLLTGGVRGCGLTVRQLDHLSATEIACNASEAVTLVIAKYCTAGLPIWDEDHLAFIEDQIHDKLLQAIADLELPATEKEAPRG